jgi:aminoglycoside 6'-N-acetyltransferase
MNRSHFIPLQTQRLILRHFRDEDLTRFLAYRNDPEVARYQSWTSYSEKAAQAFIQEMKNAQPGIRGEWFQFAIELKATGSLIGDCALQVNAEDGQQGEVGFTLDRTYQGQGLALEAVSALFGYAFTTLQLHRITAICDCRNIASYGLMERLGMRREAHYVQNFWFKGNWTDEYLYAILQHEWFATQDKANG